MKSTALQTVFLLGILSISQSSMAATGTSFELMCRNKAKEIAAETYNNCVTENKQSQIKEVRSEYEAELAALKKRMDAKLKKISKGEIAKPTTAAAASSDDNIGKQNNKPSNEGYIKRSSGARELPMNSDSMPKDTPKDQLKSDLSNNTDASSIEIVEIPAEQE
ncbi:hypothetical protein [Pseudobdellovibrio sp. HCB154]|uniref:hypothetical protein n=1 Tax=Pseudobdellovibrio sp. HCB154 TaxID=3386277 RepID=UPI003916D575